MSENDKQSQHSYERLILDTSSIGVVITRLADGIILYANPALGRILGIPNVAEVIGTPVPNFYWDPSERALVLEKFRAEGKVDEYELRARQMNGTMVWTSISVQPFVFEGEPVLLSEIVDISARKNAEQEIEFQKAVLEAQSEASIDGILVVSSEGKILSYNRRFVDMWSIPQEVVASKSDEAALGAVLDKLSAPQEFLDKVGYLYEHREEKARDTVFLKDGRVFDRYTSPVIGANGTYYGRVWFFRDVTESRRAEEEMRRFQLMAENSGEFINLADLNGNILFLNAAGQQLVGLDADEVQKQVIFNLLAEDSLAKAQNEVLPAIMQTGSWKGELRYRNLKSGAVTDVYANAYLLKNPETGEPQYLVNISRDITERKRAEEEIRRRLEIESLLTGVSSKLAAAEAGTIDSVISESLEALGKFSRADRGYLFLIAEDRRTMSNTHEWRAEGIESHIARLQNIPLNAFPWLMERLSRLEVVNIPAVEDLPAEAGAEKEEFQAEAIQSIIVIPIVYQNQLAGFVGFDAVAEKRTWEMDVLAAIRTVGETFMTAMERIRLQREIEQTLEKRGRQVQITNEISQEIAAAPELSGLIERVVTLTKERFGYYHVQLLRYDPTQDAVVLLKGYGETGQKMLEAGHKMPMGSGFIGIAAATGETVMRPTLASDPDWRPNPLLPETKGEIAVPIKWKGQVLGVLDVQSDQAGALSEDDRLLLESLCGQIAVAIEETRLRQEMTERLEEVNRLYRAMSREGWQAYRQEQTLPSGFMFDSLGVLPAVETPKENVVALPVALPGGEELGELVIPENPRRPLTQEDRFLLEQIAEQIALALESARLNAQTQSALAQTEKLSQVSLQLNRAADLQELVKVAVETLAIEKVNRAVLGTFEYDAKGEMTGLNVVANWWNGTGHKATEIGMRYSAEVIRVINLFQTSEPLFFNDAYNDSRMDASSLQVVQRQNIRAVAALPLFTGERQIGVLLLESEEPHNFLPSEIRLFSAMGPQIATVLENRRQFERARRQAEREAMLNLISQKIQSASSVDDVLQIAARELGQALGAPITIAKLALKEK